MGPNWCVRPYLYRLPLELFSMIMDYLDLRDILYLCEDSKIPVEFLHRRHHMHELGSESILHHVLAYNGRLFP